MTTKYKIIAGFLFMMALLAVLAAFGYSRLNIASSGFNEFRGEARTTVNANAADALMREAKDRMTNFVLNLDPAFADAARKALEDSSKYVAKAASANKKMGLSHRSPNVIASCEAILPAATFPINNATKRSFRSNPR